MSTALVYNHNDYYSVPEGSGSSRGEGFLDSATLRWNWSGQWHESPISLFQRLFFQQISSFRRCRDGKKQGWRQGSGTLLSQTAELQEMVPSAYCRQLSQENRTMLAALQVATGIPLVICLSVVIARLLFKMRKRFGFTRFMEVSHVSQCFPCFQMDICVILRSLIGKAASYHTERKRNTGTPLAIHLTWQDSNHRSIV